MAPAFEPGFGVFHPVGFQVVLIVMFIHTDIPQKGIDALVIQPEKDDLGP
jgi:hypothetical protein